MIMQEIFKITDIVEEANNVRRYRIAPEAEKPFKFIPGQFIMLHLLKEDGKTFGDGRAYSISSSPTNENFIELTIKVYGKFTQQLWQKPVGTRLGVKGPYGKFCFMDSEVREAVFIAGGVGIAPIMCMMLYAIDKKLDIQMTLLYSSKKGNEIVFYEWLNRLAHEHKNLRVINTVTQLENGNGWNGETGRFDEQKVTKYVGDVKDKSFFICGSPEMTQDIVRILNKLGADPAKIKREQW